MKYDEAKLWSAVVIQAIEDTVGKNHTLRKEALQWIYSSRSFEIICELANLDFKRLKNILSKFGVDKEGFMSRTEIKTSLKNNLQDCLLFNGESYKDKFYIGSIGEIIEIEKACNPFKGKKRRYLDFSCRKHKFYQ